MEEQHKLAMKTEVSREGKKKEKEVTKITSNPLQQHTSSFKEDDGVTIQMTSNTDTTHQHVGNVCVIRVMYLAPSSVQTIPLTISLIASLHPLSPSVEHISNQGGLSSMISPPLDLSLFLQKIHLHPLCFLFLNFSSYSFKF